jgi:hypothetical protein
MWFPLQGSIIVGVPGILGAAAAFVVTWLAFTSACFGVVANERCSFRPPGVGFANRSAVSTYSTVPYLTPLRKSYRTRLGPACGASVTMASYRTWPM